MKIGIHLEYTLFPIPAYTIPVPLLCALIEMILFFGCTKFSFVTTLTFRIILIVHDTAYGITNSIGACRMISYESVCVDSSTLDNFCRNIYCNWECEVDYNCDRCLQTCETECTFKNAMIASSAMFFVNLILGIATVVVFSKLPRDPCCGPCCYPSSSQQVYSMQAAQPTSGMVSNDKLFNL